MGQRHQIYVMSKKGNDYECLGAFHDQWCYGMKAITNLYRVIDLIKKQKYAHTLSDPRVIENIIRSVYGIDFNDATASIVHNETGEGYLVNPDSKLITPERGDNNDGCTLIVIDEKEVRGCMFLIHGCEGGTDKKQTKNFTPITPEKYLSFYYTLEETQDAEFLEQYAKNFELMEVVKVDTITLGEFKKVLDKNK